MSFMNQTYLRNIADAASAAVDELMDETEKTPVTWEKISYAEGVEDILRHITGEATATPELQAILDRYAV